MYGPIPEYLWLTVGVDVVRDVPSPKSQMYDAMPPTGDVEDDPSKKNFFPCVAKVNIAVGA